MSNRHRIINILILILFFLSFSRECLAQRRAQKRRRPIAIEELNPLGTQETIQKNRIRAYDLIFDLGVGNFVYEEHKGSGDSAGQCVYKGEMYTFKASVRVMEIAGKWGIDVGGEIFGTMDRLERWLLGQKLFRVNKLYARGLGMETTIRYNFEEMGLSPYPVLARPSLGLGLVYRFFGLRRKNSTNLIENEILIPKETDFALFGIEPCTGVYFTMDDGRITGYVNIGTGVYGASVEKYYEEKAASTSPNKTYARSILVRIGVKGKVGPVFYHLGYFVSQFKITENKRVPESRIDLNRVAFDIGMRF